MTPQEKLAAWIMCMIGTDEDTTPEPDEAEDSDETESQEEGE